MGGEHQMRLFPLLERREADPEVLMARPPEGVKVDWLYLQTTFRCHFEATSALIAFLEVHVELLWIILVDHHAVMWTGIHNLLHQTFIRTLFGEPVLIIVHGIMHCTA